MSADTATAAGMKVWDHLLAGVERSREWRPPGVPEHRPAAAVVTCSDARVSPSVLFDQPAGELFVVRVAGNTLSDTARASLEYAVSALGVETIVVLGHTGCGAVAAAAAGTCAGSLQAVTKPICRLARNHPEATPTELERLNVANTIEAICTDDGELGEAARSGRLDLRGAIFDLASGAVTELDAT